MNGKNSLLCVVEMRNERWMKDMKKMNLEKILQNKKNETKMKSVRREMKRIHKIVCSRCWIFKEKQTKKKWWFLVRKKNLIKIMITTTLDTFKKIEMSS